MAKRIDSHSGDPDGRIRLQMQGVSKRFGATNALEDVSIKVAAGEVLALVGENGAGKSTLMKVCSGAIKPDAGQMRLDDEPYRPGNPLEARRAGAPERSNRMRARCVWTMSLIGRAIPSKPAGPAWP